MKQLAHFSAALISLGVWITPAFASSNEGFTVNCETLKVAVFYNASVVYPSKQDLSIRDPSRLLYDVMQIVSAACGAHSVTKTKMELKFEYDLAESGKEFLMARITKGSEERIIFDGNASTNLRMQIGTLISKNIVLSSRKEILLWGSLSEKDCKGYSFEFGAFPSDQSAKYCFYTKQRKEFTRLTRSKLIKLLGILE